LVAELGRAAVVPALIGRAEWRTSSASAAGLDAGDLDYIHLNKTAAMIEASLVMGLLHATRRADVERLRRVGGDGLAFQIVDDILDATASSEQLGKTSGRDAELHKSTYVSLHA
jgi:geranylgeranyl pyrophosphate synthase